MKSGKQRRSEIKAARGLRAARRAELEASSRRKQPSPRLIRVNEAALAPSNSYGEPDFVRRGYYADRPFTCRGCAKEEIWTAAQQKWWYEVAKGYVYSGAKLCRPCRRREQARRQEARRVHLEGVARRRPGGG